eukprot:g63769.t1
MWRWFHVRMYHAAAFPDVAAASAPASPPESAPASAPAESKKDAENKNWDDMSDEEWDEELPHTIEITKSNPEKFIDKAKGNMLSHPLVPIGVCCTAIALLGGLRSLTRREKHHYQYWMRRRVIFQGLTIGAIVYAFQTKKKEKQEQTEKDGFSW